MMSSSSNPASISPFTKHEEEILMQNHDDTTSSISVNYITPLVVKDNIFPDISSICRQELLHLYEDNNKVNEAKYKLQHASMGTKNHINQFSVENSWQDSQFRGDQMIWVTPELCQKAKLEKVSVLIKRLIKTCSHLRKCHLPTSHQNALSDFSVQFAVYPGGGTKYTKHVDAYPPLANSKEPADHKRRHLTFIYYLNETFDGGQLRVYRPESPDGYIDVNPCLDRLVVFQSEIVQHEVLPAFSTRLALTFWSSGSGSLAYRKSASPTMIRRPPLQLISSELVTENESLSECPSSDDDVVNRRRVFVSVASYRDTECKRTIVDLFLKAKYPENIFIGVVLQLDASDDERDFGLNFCDRNAKNFCDACYVKITSGNSSSSSSSSSNSSSSDEVEGGVHCRLAGLLRSQVRVIRLDSSQARGPCWARNICQSLWCGEKYYLQIDSHMRFRQHWDSYLIDLHDECAQMILQPQDNINKTKFFEPIISTYPSGYQIKHQTVNNANNSNNNNNNRSRSRSDSATEVSLCDWVANILSQDNLLCAPADPRPTLLVPSLFDKDGILRQKARVLSRVQSRPLECHLWAAGFSFCSAQFFLEKTPYDGTLQDLFFGEEISMAARMFTHGGLVFAPPEAVVYHLWSREHRSLPSSSSTSPELQTFYENEELKRKYNSQQRVRNLFCGDGSTDLRHGGERYKLGDVNSLSEFENTLQVVFSENQVKPESSTGGRVHLARVYELDDMLTDHNEIKVFREDIFAETVGGEEEHAHVMQLIDSMVSTQTKQRPPETGGVRIAHRKDNSNPESRQPQKGGNRNIDVLSLVHSFVNRE